MVNMCRENARHGISHFAERGRFFWLCSDFAHRRSQERALVDWEFAVRSEYGCSHPGCPAVNPMVWSSFDAMFSLAMGNHFKLKTLAQTAHVTY